MNIAIEQGKSTGWLRILSVGVPAIVSVAQGGIGSILRMAAAIVIISIAITAAGFIYQSSILAIDHWRELLRINREDQKTRKRSASRRR